MKYTKDQTKLLDHYRQTGNKPMSYNEIIMALSATKKDKYAIKEALNSLYDQGILSKERKKYKLSVFSPAIQPPASSPPPLPDKLIEGRFDATPLSRNYSYAFVRTSNGDFFVSSEDTLNAYHNDKVLVEPFYRGGKGDYCKVNRIVERANASMAGDISSSGSKLIFVCSSPRIHNWFEVLDPGTATAGDKVILQVTNWGNPSLGKLPGGKVTEVLGKSGDPAVELLAVIRQFQLPLEFPEEVLSALDKLDDVIPPDEINRRRDFRELFTFTIDPVSAKDFDDAVSIERIESGWRLYVHIADVAHYVRIGDPIFTEAAKRGNSFYFPKKVIPMLPEKLSNKICSLRPDEDKLCMTIVSEIDTSGHISNQYMCESAIRSNFRLAYEEVDTFFEQKTGITDPQLIEALEQSLLLSEVLTANRMKAGYIFFDLPEIEYIYDEEGFVHEMTLAEETASHKLIENFMLVANEYSALKLSQLAPFSMYRIHEDPDWQKIERLVETLSHYGIGFTVRENMNKSIQALLYSLPDADYHRVFDRIILRSMKKAKYSTEHIRHFGLALENYTHFTSPIRRLCDLVIHHLCKIYILKSSKLSMPESVVKLYADHASEQELQADEAEREIERIYKLAYFQDKVGEHFSGVVIGTNSSSLIVRLNEIPVTALLKSSQFISQGFIYLDKAMRFVNKRSAYYYQLLDKVKVQVMQVSDDIYLEFSNEPDAHIHPILPSAIVQPKSLKPRPEKQSRQSERKRVDAKSTHPKSGTKSAHQHPKRHR